jgi:hypothetical protein
LKWKFNVASEFLAMLDMKMEVKIRENKMNSSHGVESIHVRFEVFTAVNMKNGVFWDVTQWDSCKNRRFRGT